MLDYEAGIENKIFKEGNMLRYTVTVCSLFSFVGPVIFKGYVTVFFKGFLFFQHLVPF